ncbi:MAG: hypothetical protein ACLSHD_01645 [Anaerostipes hadrus]
MFYILWVFGLIAALCVIIGIPYMLIYNYKRIRAIDKKLDGMLRGLSIMFGEGDDE